MNYVTARYHRYGLNAIMNYSEKQAWFDRLHGKPVPLRDLPLNGDHCLATTVDGTVIAARWDNAGPLDEPEIVHWSGNGWYLMNMDGPLGDDQAEVGFDAWRELRDDELPTPVDPFADTYDCGCGPYDDCDHGL